MLHFIIDGYNLIGTIPQFRKLTLEQQRRNLAALLDDFRLQLSRRNKITVVFDGKSNVLAAFKEKNKIEVLFSQDEKADCLIKRIVDESCHPKSLVVVSDDKEIIHYARSHLAQYQSTRAFLKRLAKKRRQPCADESFKLDSKDTFVINQELKSLWKTKYL
jgi:predicted RNA-binding protein with PIN domain